MHQLMMLLSGFIDSGDPSRGNLINLYGGFAMRELAYEECVKVDGGLLAEAFVSFAGKFGYGLAQYLFSERVT